MVSYAPLVVGKLDDPVYPVTYTFPLVSRARDIPKSYSDPPRYVDASRLVNPLSSFETKTS